MKIYEHEQLSDEWFKCRLGKFTASKAAVLMGKTTNKGYQDLIKRIAYERITGERVEDTQTEWMSYGIETEPIARELYSILYEEVQTVGFMELNEFVGASLDGLIGQDGAIEIKCVKWNTQMDYLISNKPPQNYIWQMQFQMYVSDRKWVDFFSYHPKLQPFRFRVKRDNKAIEKIEERLIHAIQDVKKIIKIIEEK